MLKILRIENSASFARRGRDNERIPKTEAELTHKPERRQRVLIVRHVGYALLPE